MACPARSPSGSWWRWRLAGWVVGLGLSVAAAAAPVRLALPAQTTARSLIALSRQSGVEVLFLYEELKVARSPELIGEYEPAEALRRLLAGSGHVALATGEGRYVVVAAERPPAPSVARRVNERAKTVIGPAEGEVVQLEKYVVTPSRFGISDDLAARSATFTHDEAIRQPQLGEDVYRAMARVPGLAGMDYSARFWVRGASYDKVLTRLDGGTLLEPFHLKDLGGALSAIDLEMVGNIDLLTGGFTAEYGDRLAGVVLIETARPVDSRPHTILGLTLTGGRATSRGTFAEGRGGWLTSVRMGYPDVTLALASAEEIRPRYHDAFGKVEFELTPEHSLAVDWLHSRDRLRYLDTEDGDTLASRYADDQVWLRWQARWSEVLRSETVLGGSRLAWNRQGGTGGTLRLRDTRFALDDRRDLETATVRQEWQLMRLDTALLKWGVEAGHAQADYHYAGWREAWDEVDGWAVPVQTARKIERAVTGTNGGGFVAWRQRIGGHVVAELGTRHDARAHGQGGGTSPRVNVSATWGRTTWRAAWGVYRQAQGWHELAVMDGDTGFEPTERARQAVLGVEHRWREGLVGRVELYARAVAAPRAHWENLVNPVRLAGEFEFDRVRLAPTRARARGAEASLRHTGRRWRWSASYAWAVAEEEIDTRWLPVTRDQRHTVMLDGTYSPNAHWDFSAAWQFRSGWPTTDHDYVALPLVAGGTWFAPRLGPLLAARLPAYHRLDGRISRVWRHPQWTFRAFVDVFNAYGAANPFCYNVRVVPTADGYRQIRFAERSLSILPSAGMQWEF